VTQRGTGRAVGVTVAFVVIAALFVGLVFAVRAGEGLGYNPPAVPQTTGASITLLALPDSMVCHGSGGGAHPEWVTYCPSTSIKVPAHSTVTVTIRQYDTGEALHNPFFARVRGTVGGVMYLNGKPVSQISPGSVAHTFTIQTPPNANEYPLFVNVPLPPVPDNAPNAVTINGSQYPRPNVIVFRFKTGGPGTYVWHCYFPCGTGLAGDGFGGQSGFGGPMATTGYMSGTLTVT
jgi:hypothetical protein